MRLERLSQLQGLGRGCLSGKNTPVAAPDAAKPHTGPRLLQAHRPVTTDQNWPSIPSRPGHPHPPAGLDCCCCCLHCSVGVHHSASLLVILHSPFSLLLFHQTTKAATQPPKKSLGSVHRTDRPTIHRALRESLFPIAHTQLGHRHPFSPQFPFPHRLFFFFGFRGLVNEIASRSPFFVHTTHHLPQTIPSPQITHLSND